MWGLPNYTAIKQQFVGWFLMVGNQVGVWTHGCAWDPTVTHTLRHPIPDARLGPYDGVELLHSLHVEGLIGGASWVGDKRFLKAWRGSWHRGVCPVLEERALESVVLEDQGLAGAQQPRSTPTEYRVQPTDISLDAIQHIPLWAL